MRKRLSFIPVGIVLALMLLPTSALADGTGDAGIAAAKCSRAAGLSALREHSNLDPWRMKLPAQVLCGAFLGPGSHAMVVVIEAETCNPDFGWLVFRLRGGSWHLAWKYPNGQLSLAAVGSNIKETVGIRRPTDDACQATGGTKTRTWHWNGSRFVVSAWTTHAAPAPTPSTTGFQVRLSAGFFLCGITLSPIAGEGGLAEAGGAFCLSHGSRPAEVNWHAANVQSNGDVTSCSEEVSMMRADCYTGQGNDEGLPYLSPGQETTVGPFTCKVLGTGVECTVTATGKGFLMTPESSAEVGG
jgi:hypothetical protein